MQYAHLYALARSLGLASVYADYAWALTWAPAFSGCPGSSGSARSRAVRPSVRRHDHVARDNVIRRVPPRSPMPDMMPDLACDLGLHLDVRVIALSGGGAAVRL